MTQEYVDYLNSDKWLLKRKEFFTYCFELERYYCWLCGEKDQSLFRVHHITYRNIYKESMCDLTLLCHECHNKFHEKSPKLLKAKKKQADAILYKGRASVIGFNGNGKKFASPQQFYNAWVRKGSPTCIAYLKYCESHPEEMDWITGSINRLIERRK